MEQERNYTIYALTDDRAGEVPPASVFYVGETKNPRIRYYGHVHGVLRTARTSPVIERIREIRADGSRPGMILLEQGTGTVEDRKRAEDRWINHFISNGVALCNAQEGGKFGYKHSPETREKMSRAGIVAKADAEYRSQQSARNRSAWMDPERRQRWITSMRERGARRAGFPTAQALAEHDAEIKRLSRSGMSYADIATHIGMKPGNVCSAIKRANRAEKETLR